jgi:hypothetical protein
MSRYRYLSKAINLAFFLCVMTAQGAAPPDKMRRPDYLGIVKKYADAMIQDGRDTYGKVHSPLFASALDRKTMKIGSLPRIPKVRLSDRSLGGANPQTEYGLYALLYQLTKLTGDKRYAMEADRALKYFFTYCQSPKTGLMAWGEHIYWDFKLETMAGRNSWHEICGEWPFWDQCYRLAPDPCWKFATGQWDHQVKDKETGDYSRHAKWPDHGPGGGFQFPRYAGQMIVNWADAYGRKENAGRERREEMITAITSLIRRMEENMTETKTGFVPSTRKSHFSWPGSNLELARCLWKAAPHLKPELAQRARTLALKIDSNFHKMPHKITPDHGFITTVNNETGEPMVRKMNLPYTTTWQTGYGIFTHTAMADACYARFRQIQKDHKELAGNYKMMILLTADLYMTTDPDTEQQLAPLIFAEVIGLMFNAHEILGEKKYLDRAEYFARFGINLFLSDGLPLPRSTNRHEHYEAITGGPEFMHTLLQLHEKTKGDLGNERDDGV